MKNCRQFNKHCNESRLRGYASISSKIGSIGFLKRFHSVLNYECVCCVCLNGIVDSWKLDF
jgi:hypothetical protein